MLEAVCDLAKLESGDRSRLGTFLQAHVVLCRTGAAQVDEINLVEICTRASDE
jgi:hypothetical protein